jgi:hypothetical protein
VTLTLREEDAEYLRHLAYAVFVASEPSTAMASLRRGERPSASMAVRFLIDERRRSQKSPSVTVEREGVTQTATVGPLGELTLSANVGARPAVATADSLFVLPSPSPSPGPPEEEGGEEDEPTRPKVVWPAPGSGVSPSQPPPRKTAGQPTKKRR